VKKKERNREENKKRYKKGETENNRPNFGFLDVLRVSSASVL
jgi:hypothetical protein